MYRFITAAAFIALLTSCVSSGQGGGADSGTTTSTVSAAPARKVDAAAPLSTSAEDLAQSAAEQSGSPEPTLYRGNDRTVKMPPVQEPVRFVGDAVSLNFEQAPLAEVMHAIMGDILQLDYAVDNPVNGQVTLRTRTPIPRDDLLGVLESLLKANNVIMIRGADGRYLVTAAQGGAKLTPGVTNPRNRDPGFSIMIVPLQYISASSMAQILQPVADPEAFVRIDNVRNLLMLAGTRNQLDGWLDLVSTFDVDMLAGMSVGIFPLENARVEEVHDALQALLASGGEDGGWSQMIRIIPVTRLNAILVVTPRAHYLDTVQTWIRRMDEIDTADGEMRLYVYPVQNSSAERLAQLLNGIYATGGGVSSSGTLSRSERLADLSGGMATQAEVAPGMSKETIGGGTGGTGSGSGSFKSLESMKSRGAEQGGISSITMSGAEDRVLENVRVVADDGNNALMIYATGRQYRVIEKALEQLDLPATQVIIEASILEVQLTDDLRYGLEWSFNNNIGDDYEGFGQLLNSDGGPATLAPGFSYAVVNSVGDIKVVLNALAEDNLINVISTPSVMVLDNHEAFIHVGDQVPVKTATTTTDGGNTTESIEYKDTGVQLAVRPSVNAGGLVTMDLEQSVTDVGPIDSATGQRAFLERNIMSRVSVRSNESVVLGGLIRENASNTESGVPFLYKLPVLGPLFGSTTKSDRRTELLVIITPRAVYNDDELRAVSDEMRTQVRHMELIELPGE